MKLVKVNIAFLRPDHTSLYHVAADTFGMWGNLETYLYLCLLASRPLDILVTLAAIRAIPHLNTFLCLAISIRSHLFQPHQVVAAI